MSKDRIAELILGLIALAALIAAMILYRVGGVRIGELEAEVGRLTQYSAELEDRMADMDQPAQGGAETQMPEPTMSDAEWRFPIAESDYLMLTSPYGYRVSPILRTELYHNGIDIAATWRAQVVAVADGVVVEHWPPPDGYYRGHDVYGGMVIIEHDDGWRSLYAHLSSTRVHTGWDIAAGTVIGRVGSTGRSRGEHLHFELISPDGEPVNPALYIDVVR